jgi:hypothetical protein
MNQNNAIEVAASAFESKDLMLSADQVLAQVAAIDKIKKLVMIKGTHYDKPFNGSKDTLLKPGAEKLFVTFRIIATPTVEDLSGPDEVKYRVTITAHHLVTGQVLGTGLGVCSSNEEKYKWRGAVSNEEYNSFPEDRRRIKYKSNETVQQVRTNLADVENTVLKMADKRAYDMFEQDLEEIDHNENNINRNTTKRPTAKKAANGTQKPEGESGFFVILNTSTKAVGEGGKYTRYTVNAQNNDTGDKLSLATIKKEIGEKAQSFAGTGTIVELVFKRGQYAPDLLYIGELIVDEPEEETPAPAPAANAPAGQQSMYPEDESDLPPEMRSRR